MTDSRDEIRDVMFRYARLTDLADHDAVGEIFEHGPFRSTLGSAHGGAVLAENRKRHILTHDGSPGTRHVTTNIMIDADEEAGTARVRSYFSLFQATPSMRLRLIGAGATTTASRASRARGASPTASACSTSATTSRSTSRATARASCRTTRTTADRRSRSCRRCRCRRRRTRRWRR